MASSYDVALEIAGNTSDWWGFDCPECIEDGDLDIWWCIHCSDDVNISFADQANNYAWREIGKEIKHDELKNKKPFGSFYASGVLWVKIFTDASKEEMTYGAHKVVDALCALANYPLLDDDKYNELKYEAQLESICEGFPAEIDTDLTPDETERFGNAKLVFSWLWDNDQRALDSEDGYVPPDSIKKACWHLGWLEPEDGDDFVQMMMRFKKKGGGHAGKPE